MFKTYAVVLSNGEKHRHHIGNFFTIDEAKHNANCATCGNAEYAYVKDLDGTTMFFLRRLDPAAHYLEGPIQP